MPEGGLVLSLRGIRTGAPISMGPLGNERKVLRFPLPCGGFDAAQRLSCRRFGQRLLARKLRDQFVQDVQVVSLSQHVLSLLEFRAPRFAFCEQTTLHHVAEALYADAQVVPDIRAGLFSPTLMKIDDPR